MPRRLLFSALAVLAVVVLARLFSAALVPVIQDEAYYLLWGRTPDWGYFDHPPGVAWIGITERFAPGSVLAGRLGTMLVAALAFPFVAGLLRRAGLGERNAFIGGLLLANVNIYVLMSGVLVLPDALMITAWAAALHEAAAALGGDRRRWLTAGLAVGLGLLSKYIMVLIGPVFLWGILRGDPKSLRTPWPWAGAMVALLVFSPHLAWNARNEWVTMRMQLQHGLADGHDPGFAQVSDLPLPEPAVAGGPEERLAAPFVDDYAHGVAQMYGPPKPALLAFVQRTAEYAGALLAIWGAFLAVIVHRTILLVRRRLPPEPPVAPTLRPLLNAATWVPIVFFGLVNLKTRVEGNWAAVYVIGASVLLAGFSAGRPRPMQVFAGINIAILAGLSLFAWNPIAAPPRDRIVVETRGWREIADFVALFDVPLLVGQEQMTSMIRFYRPDLEVSAWPGINQPSEFTRRPEWQHRTVADLHERGGFNLLLGFPQPPRLPGFTPVSISELRYCLSVGLVVTDAAAFERDDPPCEDDVHKFYLVRYE